MAALEVSLDRHGNDREREGDQEASDREGKGAAPRQACLGRSLREQRVFGGPHLACQCPHIVHDALAKARGEPCRYGRGLAALAQLEHAGHLLEAFVDKRRESPGPLLLGWAIGHEVAQAAEQGMRLGCSALVGLQKVAVLRQQVSAMSSFGVDESRQRQIE